MKAQHRFSPQASQVCAGLLVAVILGFCIPVASAAGEAVTIDTYFGGDLNGWVFADSSGTATNGYTVRVGAFSQNQSEVISLSYNRAWIANQFQVFGSNTTATQGASSTAGSFVRSLLNTDDFFKGKQAWVVYSDNSTLASSGFYGIVSSANSSYTIASANPWATTLDGTYLQTSEGGVAGFGMVNTTNATTGTIRVAAAPATYLYWDSNNAAGLGGDGTWSSALSDTEWTTESGGSDTDGPYAWGSTSGTDYFAGAGLAANFGGTAGTVTVSGTVETRAGMEFATTGYTVSSGTVSLSGANATANTITVGTGTATISSVLSGSNGLTKNGTGTLTLSGSNTYTGTTTVNSGTLATSGAGIISDTSAVSVSSGAVLSLGGAETVGSIAGAGNYSLGSHTITVGGDNTSTAVWGAISGTGGLTKTGSGTLTLNGTNTYTGLTTISAGNLTLRSGGAIANNAPITIANVAGAILHIQNNETIGSLSGGGSIGGNVSIGSGITLTVNQTSDASFNGIITGAGAVTKIGSANLTLTGNNTFTGNVFNSEPGLLIITNSNALGVGNKTVNISGPNRGLALDGSAGDISLHAGMSFVTSVNGAGGRGAINNLAGNNTINGSFSLGTGDGGTAFLSNAGTLNLAGNITATATSRDILVFGAGNTTISGTISNGSTAALPLTKNGIGTLTLSGNNSYSGATTVNAGIVRATHANALGSTAGSTTVASGATLELSGGISIGAEALSINGTGFGDAGVLRNVSGNNSLAGALTLAAASTIVSDAGTLTLTGGVTGSNRNLVITGSGNTTISTTGITTGTGTLTKNGTGTLTLAATNTHSGATAINSGTLLLTGTAANSAISIASSGTLAGNGSAGSTTVQSGGRIAPGTPSTSIANLSVSGLTLQGGGGYQWDITNVTGTAGTHWDLITVGGGTANATISATSGNRFTIFISGNPVGWDPTGSYSWDIMDWGTGTVFDSTSFAIDTEAFTGATPSGAWSLANSGGFLNLSYSYVGDPVWSGGSDYWNTGFSPAIADNQTPAIFFTGASGGTATNNINAASVFSLASITFNSTAGSYTLAADSGAAGFDSSSPMQLRGNVVNNSASTQTIALSLSLTANRTFDAASGDIILSGPVSGSGGLTKNGSATLTLSGSNSFTGTTTINAGNLTLSGGLAISDGTAITLADASGAVLHIASSETIGNLSGGGSTGGNISIASGQTLTVNQTAGTTFSGTILGFGALAKSGIATLALNAENTFTGGTTLSAGTLRIDHANALGSTGNISFAGGTLQYGSGITNDLSARFKNSTSAITIDTNSQTITLGSVIDSTNSGGLTKAGAGTLVLSAANTYTGTTTINAGTLSLAASNRIEDSSNLVVSGGLFDMAGFSETVGSLSGAGSIELGAGTLATVSADSTTFSGSLSGTGGGLAKGGSGTLVLSGSNTFSGALAINAGALRAAHAEALGSTSGSTTVAGGAALELSGGISIGAESVTLNGHGVGGAGALRNITGNNSLGGAITLASSATIGSDAGSLVLAGSISGAHNLSITGSGNTTLSGEVAISTGSLAKNGSGTLILSANNTFTGGTTISAGTLQLGAAGTSGSLDGAILNNSALVIDRSNLLTLSSNISGTGTLAKNGSGTTVLSGSNTFSGGTTIQAGNLTLSGGAALSDGGSVILAEASGAILHIASSETVGSLSGGGASGGNISLASGQTLTLNQTSTGSFGGTITGSGALTKNGTATLTLSGSATHAGATTINAGTLALSGANLLSSSANVTIAAPATLQFLSGNQTLGSIAGSGTIDLGSVTLTTGTHSSTFSGTITGLGGLTKSGAGTLTLNGIGDFYGQTNILGGTLVLDSASPLRPDAIVYLGPGAILTVNQIVVVGSLENNGGTLDGPGELVASLTTTSSGTLAAVIADGTTPVPYAAGIRKITSGTTTIDAANTFTGQVRIEDGTLLLGANGSFSAATNLLTTGAGAIMDLNNKSQTFSAVNGSTGTISLGSGTLTINGSSSSTTAATLTGSGSVVKSGTGLLTLAGNSSYSGGTTVTAGNLTLTHASAAGTGSITVSNAASTLIIDTSGTISNAITAPSLLALQSATLSGNLTLNSTVFTVDALDTLTVSGNLAGSGGFTKAGSGTLLLSGNNTYSGNVTLSSGNLTLSGGSAIPNASAISIADSAGTLLHIASNETIGTLSGGGSNGGNISIAAGQTLQAIQTSNSTFAGLITGAGSFTKNGTGNLTLTGVNTFTGNVTIDSSNHTSILTITNSQALGTGNKTVFITSYGRTLRLDGSGGDIVLGSNINFSTSNDGTSYSSAPIISFAGNNTIHGSFDLTTGGGGTMIQTDSGSLTITGGFSTVVTGRDIRITGSGNTTLSGVIQNGSTAAMPITKNGTGTLTLSGNNSYSGAVTINAGVVRATNSNALGTAAGGVTVASVAALELAGGISIGAEAVSLNGSGIAGTGALRNISGNNSLAGAISLLSASTIGSDSGTLTLTGGITGTNTNLVITGSGNTTLSTAGLNIGTGTLTKNGVGTLTLSANNSYSGTTTINAGNLTLSGGSAIPNTNSVTIADAAGAVLHIAASETIGTLSGGGSTGGNVSIASGQTLTANQGADSTFAGLITGAGGFVKTGAGNLTLSGANTFTGNVEIQSSGTTSILTITNSQALGTGNKTVSIISTARSLRLDGSGGDIILASGIRFTTSNDGQTYGMGAISNFAGNNTIHGSFEFVAGGGGTRFQSDSGLLTLTGNMTPLNSERQILIDGNGNITISGTISNGLTAALPITKNGNGTFTLSGNNSYSGATTINAGVLRASHANALGSTAGSTTVASGAALELLGGISLGAEPVSLNGSGIEGSGALRNLSGDNSLTGAITLSTASVIGSSSGTLTLAGGITGSNRNLTITGSGNTTISTAAISTGSGSLTKNGTGTLILSGSNSYSGGTTLNLGNLTVQNANALGTGTFTQSSGASLFTIDTTGTVANSMSLYNVSALQSATLNGTITVNNATFDVADGDTLTISGGVGGSGGVTKNGTGTLVLSGSNSYSGATVVNAGTLNAANANALGTNASVTVNGGSLLVSADDAINSKNLILASTATGNGTAASLVFSSSYNGTAGSLTLNQNSIINLGSDPGGVIIRFSDIVNLGTYTLSIYNWTGETLWSGTDRDNTDQFYVTADISSNLGQISFYSGLDNNSFLGTGFQLSGSGFYNNQVIPVPEPETYATALLLLFACGLAWRLRNSGKDVADTPRS